jgi:hypothetical protein
MRDGTFILVDLDNNFWAGANVKSGGDKELVRSAAQKYSRKNSASIIIELSHKI